jgi:hypothetical protein
MYLLSISERIDRSGDYARAAVTILVGDSKGADRPGHLRAMDDRGPTLRSYAIPDISEAVSTPHAAFTWLHSIHGRNAAHLQPYPRLDIHSMDYSHYQHSLYIRANRGGIRRMRRARRLGGMFPLLAQVVSSVIACWRT